MTGPVSILISNTANAEGKFDFSMAFYIPEAFQESPVQPTNERVYIEERPAFEVRIERRFLVDCFNEMVPFLFVLSCRSAI